MDYASSLLGLIPGTGARRTPGLKELLSKVETYLPPEQVDRIREADEFGAAAHQGQKRLSRRALHRPSGRRRRRSSPSCTSTPTRSSPPSCTTSSKTRRSRRTRSQAKFGKDVAELVDGVTKLDQIKFKSREEAQAESFRKMLLAMVRDLRVIMVKLADRTHNMRTLGSMSLQKRAADRARDARHLRAHRRAPRHLHDQVGTARISASARCIRSAIASSNARSSAHAATRRNSSARSTTHAAQASLKKAGIQGQVESREKHLYSVYRKMRRKKSLSPRWWTCTACASSSTSPDTCYRTLGVVHAMYRPMPGRFKDYIAIPRVNGYQSLHTTLFGPNGVPIEVQIRTDDMHGVAEAGIAAHWKYKTGTKASDGSDTAQQQRARAWINHLMEMQASGNAEEFIESVKVDLFPDKVYVFTPKGDILRLPRRRHRGGFRLRGAYRRRQPLRGRQGRSPARRRCAPCCATARPWRSSPRRARHRIRRG